MSEYHPAVDGTARTLAGTLGGAGLALGLGAAAVTAITGAINNLGYYGVPARGAAFAPPVVGGFGGGISPTEREFIDLKVENSALKTGYAVKDVASNNARLNDALACERGNRERDIKEVYAYIKSNFIPAKKYIDSADVGTLTFAAPEEVPV